MPKQHSTTFQEALDTVESLPEYQQEDLIDIVRRRLIEQKRQSLAESVNEAREEYAQGEVNKGTVEDLVRALQDGECLTEEKTALRGLN